MKIINQKLEFYSTSLSIVINILISAKGSARIIGGAVRDALLSIYTKKVQKITDIDIATDLLPEEVLSLFAKHNIKAVPTGIKFGTISVFINEEKFEITTLRKDISSDGRHAIVEFSTDFEEDAARRDFTINALSYDPNEFKIYDYFDGLDDLKKHRVRFIGSPAERIKEDYLRILRFFRFSTRFAKTIDEPAINACNAMKAGLHKLSRERIKEELDKIISLNLLGLQTIQTMYNHGILQEIMPAGDLNINRLKKATMVAEQNSIEMAAETYYALMFSKNSEQINRDSLLKLKFSKHSSQIVEKLLSYDKYRKIDDVIFKKIWLKEANFSQYFIFIASKKNATNLAYIMNLHRTLSKLTKPRLPVDGNDLLKLGINGPKIKKKLDQLEEKWIKSNFTLLKNELLKAL